MRGRCTPRSSAPIGQETAKESGWKLEWLRPELVTSEYTAEGLAKALEGWEMEGMRVLVPRAEVARDALPSLLAKKGAEVEILPVYRAMRPDAAGEALLRLFNAEGVDVITFTSSSTLSPTSYARSQTIACRPFSATRRSPAWARSLRTPPASSACRSPSRRANSTTHGLVQAIAEAAVKQ